jgi:hypothetical protein
MKSCLVDCHVVVDFINISWIFAKQTGIVGCHLEENNVKITTNQPEIFINMLPLEWTHKRPLRRRVLMWENYIPSTSLSSTKNIRQHNQRSPLLLATVSSLFFVIFHLDRAIFVTQEFVQTRKVLENRSIG